MGRSTCVVSDHQYSISKAYHPLGEAKEVQTPQCGYPGLPPPELGTKVQTPRYGYTGLLPPVLGLVDSQHYIEKIIYMYPFHHHFNNYIIIRLIGCTLDLPFPKNSINDILSNTWWAIVHVDKIMSFKSTKSNQFRNTYKSAY